MTNKSKKIAILGASGHIAKNLILYLSRKNNLDLFLFSKNKKKVIKFLDENSIIVKKKINSYNNFEKIQYNTIINCTGNIKDLKKDKSLFFKNNEYYDNKIIKYLKKNPSCLYIYLSSGAIYGEDFLHPVNDKSSSTKDLKNQKYQYSKAKICSEAKHRCLSELNIIDLRIFSFFSRFVDLKSKYFLSEAISALKYKKQFVTDSINIRRDYIHPYDLSEIILRCMKKQNMNEGFDIISKKPVKKFEILKYLEKEYDFQYKINKNIPKKIKLNYYSNSKKVLKLGYKPKYSSLEAIKVELNCIKKIRNL